MVKVGFLAIWLSNSVRLQVVGVLFKSITGYTFRIMCDDYAEHIMLDFNRYDHLNIIINYDLVIMNYYSAISSKSAQVKIDDPADEVVVCTDFYHANLNGVMINKGTDVVLKQHLNHVVNVH